MDDLVCMLNFNAKYNTYTDIIFHWLDNVFSIGNIFPYVYFIKNSHQAI